MEIKKKHVAHICNLIQMAIQDNEFHEKEIETIISIATRLGLSYGIFKNICDTGVPDLEVPESMADRIKHLNDFVKVMLADGYIHPEEMALFQKLIVMYGIKDVYPVKKIEFNTKEKKNKEKFDDFLNKFQLLTGENLSSVCVDKDENIFFPTYDNKKLKLSPVQKTYYIFFLLQNKPIHINEFSDDANHKLFKDIYHSISNTTENTHKTIQNMISADGVAFNHARTIIRNRILDIVPGRNESIASQYIISGERSEPKYIKLDKKLISIEESYV